MTTALPNWVIDLVNAVATYEDEHGHPDEGHACLGSALGEVPPDVRQQAAAVREYLFQQGRTTRPVTTKEN